MSSKCDGIRCGKCQNKENCECVVNWPNSLERDEDRFYYEDEDNLVLKNYKVKINKNLVDLNDFDIEE